MSQTTSCSKCKALEAAYGKYRCSLGFKIDANTLQPMQECPRPLTYLQLMECKENIKSY
ncbi:MAG: hypothetical protein K5981_09395 [Clostridia bacterium]|nr:hypothetical protein [Clostridia bacterium]